MISQEERRTRIGGSDIGAIIGVGFKTPLELWEEKCGLSENQPPNLAMKCGTVLESIIMDEYEKVTGFSVTRTVKLRGDVDWIGGEADGIAYDDDGTAIFGVDAKFTRVGEYHDGIIPPYYAAQGQWYMSMCGAYAWDFAVLHAQNDKIIVYRLRRDEDAIAYLRDEAEKFWECVKTKTPPLPSSATEAMRYFEHREMPRMDKAEVNDEVAGKIAEIAMLRDIEQEAAASQKRLRKEVVIAVGNSTLLVDKLGNKLATMSRNGSLRVF